MEKKQLLKISQDFREIASRLINDKGYDAKRLLKNFLHFIDNTPTLSDYVNSLKPLASTLEEVWAQPEQTSSFLTGFSPNLGTTRDAETINIYLSLKDISEHDTDIVQIGFRLDPRDGDITSLTRVFGERLIKPLAQSLEQYISLLIMDINENMRDNSSKSIINASGANFQVVVSHDKSSISASQNNHTNIDQIIDLIETVQAELRNIQDRELANEVTSHLDTIKAEVQNSAPNIPLIAMGKAWVRQLANNFESTSTIAANLLSIVDFLNKFHL